MEAKQGDGKKNPEPAPRRIGGPPKGMGDPGERAKWREAVKAWPQLRYEHRALLRRYCSVSAGLDRMEDQLREDPLGNPDLLSAVERWRKHELELLKNLRATPKDQAGPGRPKLLDAKSVTEEKAASAAERKAAAAIDFFEEARKRGK